MRSIMLLVLLSFLGLSVHAQEGTPPPAGMDNEAPRDPAKAHKKKSGKKKKGHKKHRN